MVEPRPIKGFTLEDDDAPDEQSHAESLMLLALKTMSQRAIAGIKDAFVLLAVASVFWLFLTIHDPNVYQLVELAIFCLFVLTATWLVKRK